MNSKKLIAGMVALAIAGTTVASNAQAATAEELAAQIAALQSQLSGLMGQLGGTSSGTTASGVQRTDIAACTGITFSRNLTLGSSGNDVKCLQALLNTDDATMVAATGVGSAGSETVYFGGLTKTAVVKFQDKYAAEVLAPVGLTSGTGFVGASTRAKLNAMLAGTTGGTGTTGNLPAGCTSTNGYSTTTGESCAVVSTLPAGCTSTTGYSPTTGASCATGSSTGSGVTQTGAEGAITVSINSTPANGIKTYEGDSKVAVLGLKIKATGSDVDVQRATLRFSQQPYSYFTNLYLYDGDTEIATSPLNSTTVSKVTSGDYQITLAGFTSKVIVPVNTSKVLTVKVDVLPGISSGLLTAGTANVNIGTPSSTAIRAVDQAGLNQYGGVENAAAWTAGNYRTFSVNASQSANAALIVSRNTNSPLARNVVSDTNKDILGANLLTFNIKAEKDDITLNELNNVQFTKGAGYLIPTTAYLVDDSGTVIGTATPTPCTGAATDCSNAAGDADFTDLNYVIAKDTTKTFSIKIDDNITATTKYDTANTPTALAAGDAYVVTVPSGANIVAEKTNGALVADLSKTGTAASYAVYAYNAAPVFTLTSVTTTSSDKTEFASSTIAATFNIQVLAKGGDVYIPTANAFDVMDNNAATTSVSISYDKPSGTDSVTVAGGTAAGTTYKITADTTANFAISARELGLSGYSYLYVSNVDWAIGTDATAALYNSDYMVTGKDWKSETKSLQ